MKCWGERDRLGRRATRLETHFALCCVNARNLMLKVGGRLCKNVFGGTPNTAGETPALPGSFKAVISMVYADQGFPALSFPGEHPPRFFF
jgi:hypothetical protein